MYIKQAMLAIDNGCLAYRTSWEKTEFIFKEFPHSVHNSTLDSEITLPTILKEFCKKNDINLNFKNLIFKIDFSSGIVEPYFPNNNDLNGNDWEILGHYTIDDNKMSFEELLKSVYE